MVLMMVRAGGIASGGILLAPLAAAAAQAQMNLPTADPPSGADLFKRQCATCHTVKASDPKRQGPTLDGVYGRKAVSIADIHDSAGFAKADWSWDDTHLDAWITNPLAVIPGAIMPIIRRSPRSGPPSSPISRI